MRTGRVWLVLIGFAAASIGFVGAEGQRDAAKTATKDPGVTPAGEFPIVKEKMTLSVFAPMRPFVEDYATNEFTKWYEDKTNIHVQWDVVPENNLNEKRNIILASGNYPDVFLSAGFTSSQQQIYGKQGVLLDLNPYIEKYGIEFKNAVKEVPLLLDYLRDDQGAIYSLAQVNECYHCFYSQKMWIYKPWLDKLGLAVPTTTEDFYKVLKAFKERDPNGNGKADEIPLAGSPKGWNTYIGGFLMSSFILDQTFGTNPGEYFQNGKVTVSFDKPEWKEGLRYLNRLYSEGLMSPESFTMDASQLKRLGENPDTIILGAAPAGWYGVFLQNGGPSGRYKDYVAVPPLKGPKGFVSTYYNPAGISVGQFVITNKAKNPAAAYRWGDYLLTFEASIRSTIGRPGIEWRPAEKGELGIDGNQAIWYRLATYGQMQNVHLNQLAITLRTTKYRLGEKKPDDPYNNEVVLYNATKNLYAGKEIPNATIPPLNYSEAEAAELEDIRVGLTSYINEAMAKFVIGALSVDKDWDAYIKNLKGMGLDRYIELIQKAYDRKYKGKK